MSEPESAELSGDQTPHGGVSSPRAAIQRTAADAAAETDRAVEITPRMSLTAQVRRRIGERLNQPGEDEIEASAPQPEENAVIFKTVSPIQQAAVLGTGSKARAQRKLDLPLVRRAQSEARAQRGPDLPLIRRAQPDRSGEDRSSNAIPERKIDRASSVPAPVQHIQRAMESEAPVPANQATQAEGEASQDRAANKKIDLDQLAHDVYPIVKRLIAVERERRG